MPALSSQCVLGTLPGGSIRERVKSNDIFPEWFDHPLFVTNSEQGMLCYFFYSFCDFLLDKAKLNHNEFVPL